MGLASNPVSPRFFLLLLDDLNCCYQAMNAIAKRRGAFSKAKLRLSSPKYLPKFERIKHGVFQWIIFSFLVDTFFPSSLPSIFFIPFALLFFSLSSCVYFPFLFFPSCLFCFSNPIFFFVSFIIPFSIHSVSFVITYTQLIYSGIGIMAGHFTEAKRGRRCWKIFFM